MTEPDLSLHVAANDRAVVRLHDGRTARLFYVSPDNTKAKIIRPGGKFLKIPVSDIREIVENNSATLLSNCRQSVDDE